MSPFYIFILFQSIGFDVTGKWGMIGTQRWGATEDEGKESGKTAGDSCTILLGLEEERPSVTVVGVNDD